MGTTSLERKAYGRVYISAEFRTSQILPFGTVTQFERDGPNTVISGYSGKSCRLYGPGPTTWIIPCKRQFAHGNNGPTSTYLRICFVFFLPRPSYFGDRQAKDQTMGIVSPVHRFSLHVIFFSR